ncbi:MAG: sigma-70 family RNA polymerase sigma factor [Acidimicrobiales bacterium]|jgi:RNA polymerase sigma-70 factor (ECF subfamily)
MSEADEERFSAIYESTRSKIVAYVLRRTACREDAADVVAETFEIAWRRLDDIPDSPDDVLWLYVTARYVLANHHRRLRRGDDLTTRIAEGLGVAVQSEDPIDEDSLVALFCLRSLPEEDRELLMLVTWDGLSGADAGRVLGCSPTAVRIRLHRARARLTTEISRMNAPQKQAMVGGHELVDSGDASRRVPEEVIET